MATTVTMPQMGYDMTEGSVHTWIKKEGDQVEKGETIAEIDTDKATVELEAFASGILKRIVIEPGELVPVGQVIAVIAAPAEQVDWAALGLTGGDNIKVAQEATQTDSGNDQGAARKSAGEGGEALSPNQSIGLKEVQNAASVAKRLEENKAKTDGTQDTTPQSGPGTHTFYPAAEAVLPPTQLQPPPIKLAPANIINAGVATVPRTIENKSKGAPDTWIKSSPYARTMAGQLGVDLAQVQPTGPNGRVLATDVQKLAASNEQGTISQTAVTQFKVESVATPQNGSEKLTTQSPTPTAVDYDEQDLSRMRQTIARRMTEAKQTVPHFYITSEIDMGEVLQWRQRLNAAIEGEGGVKISVNDMVVKAAAKALLKYPALNSSYTGSKVRFNHHINIAMAVALGEGLITPVINDVDKKSLGTIATDARSLIEKARAGSLRPEEFQGGTFTVSNLGMYDVDSFVAIINPPQAAILAVGSTKPTVVVKSGTGDEAQFGVVQMMKVTISADHRVTDGAVAAQFLQELKRILQNPLSLLI